jgi:hypothetical protein
MVFSHLSPDDTLTLHSLILHAYEYKTSLKRIEVLQLAIKQADWQLVGSGLGLKYCVCIFLREMNSEASKVRGLTWLN